MYLDVIRLKEGRCSLLFGTVYGILYPDLGLNQKPSYQAGQEPGAHSPACGEVEGAKLV